MKIVIINGSSCSGKSTIVENVMEQEERLFHLSYDRLKWLFSKYSSSEQYKDVWEVVLAVAETVFEMRYHVIADSVLYKKHRQKIIELAKRNGYEVLEINLEADYAGLSRRFDERVASAMADPKRKISNISEERFKELYDIFQSEKNPRALTFRTDTQGVEEISAVIIDFYNK